jgi:hypothetical protein
MFLYFRMAQEEEDDNQEDPCPDSSLSMTTITPAATVLQKRRGTDVQSPIRIFFQSFFF